jgi:aerobic carbon-monoxide dehydrogenase large subunit
LAAIGWDDFPKRQADARANGRFLGIGLAHGVKGTGRGPFESGIVRVSNTGRVTVYTGAAAIGQGLQTALAQVAASELGLRADEITVVPGDTSGVAIGLGAFASRQTVTAGNAVLHAARAVRDKALGIASALLEAAPEDLELADGAVRVRGAPQMHRTLADIARAVSGTPGFALPAGTTPGLSAAHDYQPSGLTYCNGTHLCEVEIDPELGRIALHRYIVVHDCGRMIDRDSVEGQVRGAVAHGIGATLYEWMRFDEDGQPLTATFADYLLPTADCVPMIEIHHMESPTPLNPLGVKGAAESGTIAAPAALISAIEDALAPLDLAITDLPLTPARLFALIRSSRPHS